MNFKNIVNKLCSQFDSKAYDQDILKYGLEVLIYNLFTILILIVLSILFQNCGFGLYFQVCSWQILASPERKGKDGLSAAF